MTIVLTVPLPQTVLFIIIRPSRDATVNSGTKRVAKSVANPLLSRSTSLPTRSHGRR